MNRLSLHHLVILALVVGGSFELIKSFRFSGVESTSDVFEDLKPYARKDHDLSQSKALNNVRGSVTARAKPLMHTRQSGLFIPAQEGQFEAHGPKSIAGQVANGQNKAERDKKKVQTTSAKCRKKKAADGEEVVAEGEKAESLDEPKQLQLSQAKPEAERKKDEEVECEDEDNIAKNEVEPEEESQETKPDTVDGISPTAAIIGGLVTNTDGELSGLEEWKARVLNQPNFKETVRLIEAVQSGQLSTATFYVIVRLMLEDGRPEMRELGVLAAGRTPSYESYHILVSVLKRETFGSSLRNKAESELNYYKNISQLGVLERVMRNSTDVFAVIWATRLVDDSARKYLTAKYNQGTTNPFVKRFQNFVALLEELSRSTHDAQQAAQARQTLFSLQDLLRAYT